MELNRRLFIATSVAGAFSLGWKMPAAAQTSHIDIRHPGCRNQCAGGSRHLGRRSIPMTRVVVRIARSEMGQGTLTGLAQLVADEMDADWSIGSGQSMSRRR